MNLTVLMAFPMEVLSDSNFIATEIDVLKLDRSCFTDTGPGVKLKKCQVLRSIELSNFSMNCV